MPLTEDCWPDDADGDVFRRLAERKFDFASPHQVDYNVDFNSWPPAQEAIDLLASLYGSITLHEPSEHLRGYIMFQVNALLTYESVTSIQHRASVAMEPFGGICESWGVAS